jgi:hypothetical protein
MDPVLRDGHIMLSQQYQRGMLAFGTVLNLGLTHRLPSTLLHLWLIGLLLWASSSAGAVGTSHFLICIVVRCLLGISNALTLERVTAEYPRSGSLITFSQFLVISLHGLPKFLTVTRGPLNVPVPRLLPRRIPLTPYLVQVGLFYSISLLNNLAFGYSIPMPVHIIFRSGGLVITLLMGWLISGKS